MARSGPALAAPFLLALALGAPHAAVAQDAEPGVRAAITQAGSAWEDAFNRGDAAGVAATYAADGQILPPGGDKVSGREGIQQYWAAAIEAGGKTQLTTEEVHGQGDMAIEVGSYVGTGADGAHLDHGKYIVVWKKTDDGWKIHRDIWNSSMGGM